MGSSIRIKMNKSSSTAILIVGFLLLFNNLQSQYRFKPRHEGRGFNVTRVDFMLAMNDGTLLDCTRFFPDETPPAGGWPALIYCHGFGGTKYEDLPYAEEQAADGFFTFVYTMRGQGISGGKTNLISTLEMGDFTKVVNYVKSQSIVNVNRVGAIGGSQGGTIPFMAACNGTSLRCIVSDVSNPKFASDWIYNKSVKMSLLWTLSYDTTIVRYNNLVKAFRTWILADTPDKYDSLLTYIPQGRDFSSQVGNNNAPIFISTCWQDKFFSTKPDIEAIPFINPDYRMYFGTFGSHGSEAYEDEVDYHNEVNGDWLYYWLDDYQNGALDSSQYVYASSSYPRVDDMWTWKRFYSDVWPPAGVQDVKFYLRPNRTLTNAVSSLNPDTVGFDNNILDNSLTMLEAVNREFTGSIFESKFQRNRIIFETPTLTQNARMVGTPFVNIHYKSNTTKAQFNLQIYEIKPGNEPYIVGRANYTDRNITPNQIRQLSFYGSSCSHVFQAGSKLRIVLTNIDNIDNDPFLRTNPYVLPSFQQATNIIYMNPANPTYIQLPMIGWVTISVNPISTSVPDDYSLSQNYPNPFNPSTKIRFELPKSSHVNLVIYDAVGRQVATLADDRYNAGTYEAEWKASDFSSGVYFYRLTTESFISTKKMLLIK